MITVTPWVPLFRGGGFKKKIQSIIFRWGLVFFIQLDINHHGLFNIKDIFAEEQWWYSLRQRWRDEWFRAFHNSIHPKVKVLAWLKLEYSYYDVTGQHFNHYAMGTFRNSHERIKIKIWNFSNLISDELMFEDYWVLISWFVGWFVWFYGISTLAGYLTPNPFLCK